MVSQERITLLGLIQRGPTCVEAVAMLRERQCSQDERDAILEYHKLRGRLERGDIDVNVASDDENGRYVARFDPKRAPVRVNTREEVLQLLMLGPKLVKIAQHGSLFKQPKG
jgi:hypothetical protein